MPWNFESHDTHTPSIEVWDKIVWATTVWLMLALVLVTTTTTTFIFLDDHHTYILNTNTHIPPAKQTEMSNHCFRKPISHITNSSFDFVGDFSFYHQIRKKFLNFYFAKGYGDRRWWFPRNWTKNIKNVSAIDHHEYFSYQQVSDQFKWFASKFWNKNLSKPKSKQISL